MSRKGSKLNKNKKVLLLLSGGLDSSVILYSLLKKKLNILCITFNYSQNNRIEIKYAEKLVKENNITDHLIIKLDKNIFLNKNETGFNMMTDPYIPGRNTIFLSIAFSIAEKNNISDIYIGANKDDRAGFPDCREEYFKKINELFKKAGKKKISVKTPLVNKTKKEILLLGEKYSLDINKTLSCYNPVKKRPCGICPACLIRKNSLKNS